MKGSHTGDLRVAEDRIVHPVRMLWIVVGGVVGAEALFEMMVYFRPTMSPCIEAILDGSYILAVTLPLVYIAVYRPMRHLIDQYRSAIDEVRTLRGIITICSACKKIRSDAQSWDQMEAYVQAHSEATFSHGLCPDCIQRLYPEDAEWISEQMKIHRPHIPDTAGNETIDHA